jgi:bacteriocin-like protein
MEKIMSTEISELTETELNAVSGGSTCAAGRHFAEASLDVGGSTTDPTPSSAWNACLGVLGYGPQAK